MPIATGAVTDLGASERSTASRQAEQPAQAHRGPTAADPPAVAASSAHARASQFGAALPQRPASATTAGPSRKWMNCAPEK